MENKDNGFERNAQNYADERFSLLSKYRAQKRVVSYFIDTNLSCNCRVKVLRKVEHLQ